MRKRQENSAADDEAKAFRDSMRGVKPIESIAVPSGLEKPPPKRIRKPRVQDSSVASAFDAPPLADAETLPDEHLSFRRPGIQDQVMKRLRRGLIPVQAEIDLHGQTQQAAWDNLRDFLEGCRDRQMRCVSVIHGKGYRSGARGPVLKTAVNAWLRRNHDVVAFTSARAIDGGAGALYVLLRA